MDAAIKRKWVKALRSGKYEQARGWLKSDGAYCCIGVGYLLTCQRFRTNNTFTAAKNIGLTADQQETLVSLNDHDCLNFKEIADYIEKNL